MRTKKDVIGMKRLVRLLSLMVTSVFEICAENGCPEVRYMCICLKIGNVLVETNDATQTTPMPPASAKNRCRQIDRVPTATNVPSFIEPTRSTSALAK